MQVYILLIRLGLEINFIQWIALRSYNDTHFVTVELFAVAPEAQVLDLKVLTLCGNNSETFL